MDDALITNDHVYKEIFDNLPFIAFTMDRTGKILEANRHTQSVIGKEASEIIGRNFTALGFLDRLQLLKAFHEFSKNLAGKITDRTIYEIKLPDGRTLFFELIGIPIIENGKVIKVLDVGIDVTATKQQENELNLKLKELRYLKQHLSLTQKKHNPANVVSREYQILENIGKVMTELKERNSYLRAYYDLRDKTKRINAFNVSADDDSITQNIAEIVSHDHLSPTLDEIDRLLDSTGEEVGLLKHLFKSEM